LLIKYFSKGICKALIISGYLKATNNISINYSQLAKVLTKRLARHK